MTTGEPQNTGRYEVFEEGHQIDDDLTVIEHLNGTRKVDLYLCKSKQRKGLVACKVLRWHYATDYSALESMLEEGNRILRLHHPLVVEGHSIDLLPYPRVVQQYLPGQTLNNIFFKGNYTAFDINDFVSVTTQLADALTYVHSRGLLHLDVKPGNVMYDDGAITLFDFSVAEDYSPDKPLRDNAGTTEYMAPEQTYRKEVGYATDVFGMGVVFYQLLANGTLPYPVVKGPLPGYDKDDIRKHLDYSTPPRPPSALNPGVPRALNEVSLRAIQTDMDKRYATPDEFKAALLKAT